MSGVKFSIPSPEVALAAGVAKTVLSAAAATNHRTLVKAIKIFFKGVLSTDTPVLVELIRITTGTGTASASTEVKINEADNETLQTTGRHNFSAEPTVGDVIERWEVHPQTGIIELLPPGEEITIIGGNEMGIRMTAAQNQTVTANFTAEE